MLEILRERREWRRFKMKLSDCPLELHEIDKEIERENRRWFINEING